MLLFLCHKPYMAQALFETFSLEFDSDLRPQLKSHACRKTGELPELCAHRHEKNLHIAYRSIRQVEVVFGVEEFRGESLEPNSFAVSFRPDVYITTIRGDLLLPKDDNELALSRVTYWNVNEADVFHLAFLRHKEDTQLFISGCKEPSLLMRIATQNAADDSDMSSTAYGRALQILDAHPLHDAEANDHFISYIAAEIQRGNQSGADQAILDFRRVDRTGAAALSLAALLHEHGRGAAVITPILEEAVPRLIKRKPRHYSMRLGAILDFVMAEKYKAPSPGQLLWQTYLAASAERATGLLRKLFAQAKKLKADRETLEMIYKTWRGFAHSEQPQEKEKQITPPKWLAAPLSALKDTFNKS